MKNRKDNYEQIAEKLSCELLNKLNKDINSINTHEAYEVVDMIKDLEESMYKYDISEAMNQHEYKMTSDTYKSYSPKELRDMDKAMGRMYYTETHNTPSPVNSFTEKMGAYHKFKAQHPDDEQGNLNAVNEMANGLLKDIKEVIRDMSHSEKTMLRTKMQNMIAEIN